MLSRPLLDRVAFLGISWYAVLIVGAMVIGYFLASNEARRLRLPQDTVIDFMLYAVPLGIICARLYYVAFRFNDYSDNLLSVFNIREGGLAIYGGVIGGLIAAKLVSRKHKISHADTAGRCRARACARSGHRPLGQLYQYGSLRLAVSQKKACNSSPSLWKFPSATYGTGTWRRFSTNSAGTCSSSSC